MVAAGIQRGESGRVSATQGGGRKTGKAAAGERTGERLLSIDALRGFDMFWIVGGDVLATKLLERSTSADAARLKLQFEHVDWAGFRFYDLIFPLFMFLVGCVIPFSLSRYQQQPSQAWSRILRRTALLFLLGLVCNGLLQFRFGDLRYPGVLQRIALCYGISAVLFLKLSARGLIATIAGILLSYWALLALVPAPGSVAGDFSKAGNLPGYVDRALLPGRIPAQWYGDGDNEGILSTIPAVSTVLLGCLAGLWLRTDRSGWGRFAGLCLMGGVLLSAGYSWGVVFPIIKNLWTSSFVLVAAGWSMLLLSAFYLVIDVMGFRRWAFFWAVIGVNAITIYVVPRFVDFDGMAAFFLSGIARLSGAWGEVVLAVGVLSAQWLFLLYLYRNRIFLRL